MQQGASSSEAKGSVEKPPQTPQPNGTRLDFPVVAVWASPGGVADLSILLKAQPSDVRAAFVIILPPADDSSALHDALMTSTTLPVRMVREDQPLLPGVVSTWPPGQGLIVEGGVLKRLASDEGSVQRPVDRFLESLASDQGEGAVCVILNSSGSDGAAGIESIHAYGGMVLAQKSPTAASHDAPDHTVAIGHVDAVLPIEQLAVFLSRILCSPHLGAPQESSASSSGHEDLIARIVGILAEHTGHDLSGYKRSTVGRRIHKRLMLSDVGSLAAYADLLAGDPQERSRLFSDLLIGVTRFFRDEEAFEALLEKALPELFRDRSGEEPVRVWVACCSTGEEAYSVAMLIDEHLAASDLKCPVTIFASDIHREPVIQARKGAYPDRIREDLSARRLNTYFTCSGQTCTIIPRLRENIVFAQHNLLQDPPFLHMDLVICRNFLIYLQLERQKKVLSTFTHALNPGGYLLLGPAETIGDLGGMFDAVDRKWRLYRACPANGYPICLPVWL